MIKVSIMIPTMTGGLTHLSRLMPLLSREADAEIIVIDNNSRDGTTNYLSNYRCTVIINTENVGFAKANNQAARIAQGEYLLLLNNDTIITPGFLQQMIDAFSATDNVGIVGCAIYTMDLPKKILHAGVYFTEQYVPYELGLPVPGFSPGITNNDDRVAQVREVPAVTGACLMIKKSIWEELGGLNEAYRNGWEDNDLCLRVREKGYKVWYTGKAQIMHKKFGSHDRFKFEDQNRNLYDSLWVHNGKAKEILSSVAE